MPNPTVQQRVTDSKKARKSTDAPDSPPRSLSQSRLKAAGAEGSVPKSVLYGYAGRPTTTKMAAVRPPAGSSSDAAEEAAPLSEADLHGALSARPVPNWDDREAPATVPPQSVPPHFDVESENPDLVRGVLTRIDGPDAGRVYSLAEDQLTLGRSHHADLHVTEDGVSRKHARICYLDGGFVVEDLDSRNGTFVGSQRSVRVQLRQGDVVRLGPVATFRFCWMDRHQEGLVQQLYETSVRDGLTGAFNRRYLQQRIDSEIAYAQRHGGALSVLLLDIDFFKRVNDRYGHLEGDRVLGEVAVACQRALRVEDTFARYGGEEFAAILRGIPLLGATRAAERLREAVSEGVRVGSPGTPVTVSVGCSTLGANEQNTAEQLILVADRYLYEAKQAGRNRVCADGYLTAS